MPAPVISTTGDNSRYDKPSNGVVPEDAARNAPGIIREDA